MRIVYICIYLIKLLMYHMKWVARVQLVKYLPILDTDHDYHLATEKEKNKMLLYTH